MSQAWRNTQRGLEPEGRVLLLLMDSQFQGCGLNLWRLARDHEPPMNPYCLVPLSCLGYAPCINGSKRAVTHQAVASRILCAMGLRTVNGTVKPWGSEWPCCLCTSGPKVGIVGRLGALGKRCLLKASRTVRHDILGCCLPLWSQRFDTVRAEEGLSCNSGRSQAIHSRM